MNQKIEDWKKRILDNPVADPNASVEFTVVGGGGSSGKTSSTNAFLLNDVLTKDSFFMTPELIIGLCPELGISPLKRHPEKDPKNYNKYRAVRDDLVLFCLNHGLSVVLDDHCGDLEDINNLLVDVVDVDAVNKTTLIGITAERESYLSRVQKLEKLDYDFALESSQQFFDNIPELCKLFDRTVILESAKAGLSVQGMLDGYVKNGDFIVKSFNEDSFNRIATISGDSVISANEFMTKLGSPSSQHSTGNISIIGNVPIVGDSRVGRVGAAAVTALNADSAYRGMIEVANRKAEQAAR